MSDVLTSNAAGADPARQPTRYLIELEAGGSDSRPAAIRLRQLLKHAGRCCGLRCVKASEVPSAVGSDVAKP